VALENVYVEWGTKIIHIPRNDLFLVQTVPSEIRQLDVDALHDRLKDIEDDEDGIAYLDTHSHNPSVTISGAILAPVVEIINGYTVTFENGLYAVNLVAANTNVGDVTNVNFVSVRSSNSAGLQNLTSLQSAAFHNGMVYVNPSSIYDTEEYPSGVPAAPVNNMPSALEVANFNGLDNFMFMKSFTLDNEAYPEGQTFNGTTVLTTTLTILPTANIVRSTFRGATITGTLSNSNLIDECIVLDITYDDGFISNSAIAGTITLHSSDTASLVDCYSINTTLASAPIVNMTGAARHAIIRDYTGTLKFTNSTDPANTVTVDLNSGVVILDSTVTEGTFLIRGDATIVNNSTGNVVIIDETISAAGLAAKVWDYDVDDHVPGSVLEFIRTKLLTFTRFLANK